LYASKRIPIRLGSTALLALLSLSVLSLLGGVSVAHANVDYTVSGTLDSTLCANNGGSWDSTFSTCTVAASSVDWTVAASTTLTIPDGVRLVLQNYKIDNFGTIDVAGEFWLLLLSNNHGTLENSGNVYIGGLFENDGSLINSGFLQNDWFSVIDNLGTISNSGTIYNQGEIGFSGAIINSGTIDDLDGIRGSVTNECGGILDGQPPVGGVTQLPCPSVPQFSGLISGPLLVAVMLLPALLIFAGRFRRPA
jgi:hypothetical protein